MLNPIFDSDLLLLAGAGSLAADHHLGFLDRNFDDDVFSMIPTGVSKNNPAYYLSAEIT